MRVIVSPAKKMRVDTDAMPWEQLPQFLPQAEVLWDKLREMDRSELKRLWKCNDQIVEVNLHRLHTTDLRHNLTPAILSYEGIQYQYMAPGVFTGEAFAYVQEHLRILSGLYGVLRPFDGVTPYRLEMQAKLQIGQAKDLYGYWGDRLFHRLYEETDCVINLASKEYSLCVSRYLERGQRMITCVFGQRKQGKVVEKGTLCKMARGEMVRFLAEEQIQDPEQIQGFSGLGYRYSPEFSRPEKYVFLATEEPDGQG